MFDDGFDFLLRHGSTIFQVLIQVATPAYLHEEIEVVVLDEGRVELDDIGVVEESLDFYLPDALEEHFAIGAEESVRDLFESENMTGYFVSILKK